MVVFSGTNSGSGSMETLKQIVTSPIFYSVLGGLFLLAICIYLLSRVVKSKPNATILIVRGNNVYKIVDENNPRYYLVPFRDKVGATILNGEKTFSSNMLFINNGPDALYRIDYNLKYIITSPENFYQYIGCLEAVLPTTINDELRLFADQGNALMIVKDYRQNEEKLLEVINKGVGQYFIEVTSLKINSIEPIGRIN